MKTQSITFACIASIFSLCAFGEDKKNPKSKAPTVSLIIDGMGWINGRLDAVRAALATTPGVYNLRVPGQESSKSPIVKSVGQIIQYTGNAKPEEVIAILNNQNSFMRARSADDTAIKPFIAFDPTTNPLMRLLEPKPEQRRKEVKVPTLKYGYYLWGLHKEQEVEPPLLFKLEGEAKLQPWFDEFGSGIGTPSILTGPTPR